MRGCAGFLNGSTLEPAIRDCDSPGLFLMFSARISNRSLTMIQRLAGFEFSQPKDLEVFPGEV